ncbi:MAG: PilZ domain-containing protein [Acidobacteriota bacterium]
MAFFRDTHPFSGTDPDDAPSDGLGRRRSPRLPIRGVLVAVDAPSIANDPWVVDAIDVNADGMGLVLPPELPENTSVLLSFQLDDLDFAQVPATVRHLRGSIGGVVFGAWPQDTRLQFLEYLVMRYEKKNLLDAAEGDRLNALLRG